jgi:hypothetical protein
MKCVNFGRTSQPAASRAETSLPLSSTVHPLSGTCCRPTSVTKPERSECTENSSPNPANKHRFFTMSRTAAGDRGSPITLPRRTRRKTAPDLILDAASQTVGALAARPAAGLSFSGRSTPY